jgi:hypothetical protein
VLTSPFGMAEAEDRFETSRRHERGGSDGDTALSWPLTFLEFWNRVPCLSSLPGATMSFSLVVARRRRYSEHSVGDVPPGAEVEPSGQEVQEEAPAAS